MLSEFNFIVPGNKYYDIVVNMLIWHLRGHGLSIRNLTFATSDKTKLNNQISANFTSDRDTTEPYNVVRKNHKCVKK